MKVEYICCAGLDVHKGIVVACVLKGALGEQVISRVKSFGTTTPELMKMIEGLKGCGATQVAMEATGNSWMPIDNLLEGHFELVVANAAHIKGVPGRKSDVEDAEWIADLLRHGLLRASFIPSREQRALRELTRHRSALAGKRAQAANELQKSLESANIQLQSVLTDITGASSMEMLQELTSGRNNPRELAQLAKRRRRAKIPEVEKALSGTLRRHHRMILEELLADVGLLPLRSPNWMPTSRICSAKSRKIIDRLDDTPGINRRMAEIVIAEAATDMNRFSKPISLCFLDRPLSGIERKCRQTKKRPDSQR
jgi:transposase